MADYTNIDDPSAYFTTTLYTGNGSTQDITNDANAGNFKPDYIWTKARGDTGGHAVQDSSRGAGKQFYPSSTSAEEDVEGVSAFLTNGFSLGSNGTSNADTITHVAWQWKCNGGTTSSNTDGDLTSTVQVNSTAKFSIFLYTGIDPIEPLDIGHGLGAVPEFFIIKSRSISGKYWAVYHKDMAATPQNNYLRLNSTNAVAAASTWWRNEAPTSTIIKTGEQDDINRANATFAGYAWVGVQGYSKFGKYTGTGNANGPFVYTGFKPAFVMIKPASAVEEWVMIDTARNPINQAMKQLKANSTAAEYNGASVTNGIDILSNGFKVRTLRTEINTINATYIYAAFAENPFVTSTDTNSIPATAR
jgi:hypothetical protein